MNNTNYLIEESFGYKKVITEVLSANNNKAHKDFSWPNIFAIPFLFDRYTANDHLVFIVGSSNTKTDATNAYPQFGINNKMYYWDQGQQSPYIKINTEYNKKYETQNYFGIPRTSTYNDMPLSLLSNLVAGSKGIKWPWVTLRHKVDFIHKMSQVTEHHLMDNQNLEFSLVTRARLKQTDEIVRYQVRPGSDILFGKGSSLFNRFPYYLVTSNTSFIFKPRKFKQHIHNKTLFDIYIDGFTEIKKSELPYYLNDSVGELVFKNMGLKLSTNINFIDPTQEGKLVKIGTIDINEHTRYDYQKQKTVIDKLSPDSKQGLFLPYKGADMTRIFNMNFNKIINKKHNFYYSSNPQDDFLEQLIGKVKLNSNIVSTLIDSQYYKFNKEVIDILKQRKENISFKGFETLLKKWNDF